MTIAYAMTIELVLEEFDQVVRYEVLASDFATHCDTLQHTALLCNTLQHTATHCNTQTGSTLMKRRHLTLLGYNLVSIPFYEWNALNGICVCTCVYVYVCACVYERVKVPI